MSDRRPSERGRETHSVQVDDALVAPFLQLVRVVSPEDTKEVGRTITSQVRRCRLRRRPSILRRLKRRVERPGLQSAPVRMDVAAEEEEEKVGLLLHVP